MKRILLLLAVLYCTASSGQYNMNYIRTDSSLAITDKIFPDDTLFKFTKSGHLVKYAFNSPVDTFVLKSQVSPPPVGSSGDVQFTNGNGNLINSDQLISGSGFNWNGQNLYIDEAEQGNYFYVQLDPNNPYLDMYASDTTDNFSSWYFSLTKFGPSMGAQNDLDSIEYIQSERSINPAGLNNEYYTYIYEFGNKKWKDYAGISLEPVDPNYGTVNNHGAKLYYDTNNLTSVADPDINNVQVWHDYVRINLNSTPMVEVSDSGTTIEDTLYVSDVLFDTTTRSYSEGLLHYDPSVNALTFYNDIAEFSHQLGYENVRRVYNNTGAIIPDGRAVIRIGTHSNGDIIPTVSLAGCTTIDSALVYGVTTTSIPNGDVGIVTISGNVRGLNNVGLTDTSGYLGFAGQILDTCPPPPYLCVYLGEILYSDNDSGTFDVSIAKPIYNPRPILTAQFTQQTINVTNPGTGQYALITNGTNDLYTIKDSVGFTYAADSFRVNVSGAYDLDLAYSLYNSATQTDDYRVGIFINGSLEFSMLRSVSNVSKGVNSFPQTLTLNNGDWLSVRITNLITGTRNAVFNDGILKLIYLGD